MKASLFIDRERFQLRFILQFIRTVFIGICFASLLFYFLTLEKFDNQYDHALYGLFKLNRNILLNMFITAFITLIATSLSVWFLALASTNKIAGPVYRLENNIEAIGKGNLTVKTGFRKEDALNNLGEELERTRDTLNCRFSMIETHLKEVRNELADLGSKRNKSPEKLLEKVRDTRKALSWFHTDNVSECGENNAC